MEHVPVVEGETRYATDGRAGVDEERTRPNAGAR
jgi:hypothetical protein